VDHADLITAVRQESGALTFALEAGPTDVAVPTCGGWTVGDLAVHVGNFCGFWSHVLCEGARRPKTPLPDPPSGDGVVSWVAGACADLISGLEATPAATEVWTWYEPDQTAGFVARRCAHELSVHRYDAQSARGICTPIPIELAVDGIDEVLDVLITTRDQPAAGSGRSLALLSTDVGSEWFVALEPGRIEVERHTGDEAPREGPDLFVGGTASDLELTLYRRPALSPLDVHGDDTVLEEWYRHFAF
jgi:uncharacterized protein (TIGR03083 family)